MKYSFLIPFIPPRMDLFSITLDGFKQRYKDRKDYELCITMSDYQNPCVAFNAAALRATGDYFILTSPECRHDADILAGFDEEIQKHNGNCYVVCSCLSYEGDKPIQWYQHSEYNNRQYHFCTCISRKNYFKAGGFCEAFKYGQGFDDDDWIERVRRLQIPIVTRDDLQVSHMDHTRNHLNREKSQINCDLYNFIWDKQRIL